MTCQLCRAETQCDIHHKTRRNKAGKWADEPTNLIRLCRPCHSFIHRKRKREDWVKTDLACIENGYFVELPQWLIQELYQVKSSGTDKFKA